MRWESLFADLEAQLELRSVEEAGDLRADAERQRLAALTLRDRLIALAETGLLRLRLADGRILDVEADRFGRDWLSGVVIGSDRRQPVVVPITAVVGVLADSATAPSSAVAVSSPSAIIDRLTLGVILRELCRRRMTVTVSTQTGSLTGTIDRVGADHIDVAVHDQATPRRRGAVRGVELIPLVALVVVAC